MSMWGVGPQIIATTLIYGLMTVGFTWAFPEVFVLANIPHGIFVVSGIGLLVLGLPLLAIAGHQFTQGFKSSELITTGAFAVVRNPIYAVWGWLLVPGIALLFRSWLVLSVPLFYYFIFRLLIRREEVYLEQRFGPAYLHYKQRVNAFFPFPVTQKARARRRRPL